MSIQQAFTSLRFALPLLFLLPIAPAMQAQDAPRLFDYWRYYSDAENTLYKHYCEVAFEQLDDRKSAIAALQTKADWEQRQTLVRSTLKHLIGSFPEKTPLHATTTGRLKGDGFRVEKILFESMPGYPVTSALFIPEGVKKRAPAVLYCCGHTENGFRSETYQHVIINLVKKGFVVLAFDPIGQGERRQFFDPDKGKSMFASTREHSYPGSKCFVAGYSPAMYFIWDGIRAIDYLLTRREVDPERIGVTGRSGGGTQSSYIGAVDERVLAAAPENFITDLEHLWKSRGPQDAEQNFLHATARGFDHADLIELRAPKPTMLIATTRDIFSIQGTTDTYREAKRAFEAFGAPQNLTMVQDDDVHASTRGNREALYAFFQEHLSNPGSSADEEVALLEESALYVTAEGNLYPDEKYKDLHALNRQVSREKLDVLEKKRSDHGSLTISLHTEISLRSGAEVSVVPGKTVYSGTTKLDGIFVDAYLLEGSGAYWLPVLVYRAGEESSGIVLHVSEKGKSDQGMDMRLARQGYLVYTADLPGIGELGPGYLKGDAYIDGVSHNQWYASMITGGSITGLWASDIGAVYRMAESKHGDIASPHVLISDGNLVPAALHVAHILQNRIEGLVAIDGLVSWADLMETRNYEAKHMIGAVPDVLQTYDLPDIVKSLSMRVLALTPRRADGSLAERNYLDNLYFAGQYTADEEKVQIEEETLGEDARYEKIVQWLEVLNP